MKKPMHACGTMRLLCAACLAIAVLALSACGGGGGGGSPTATASTAANAGTGSSGAGSGDPGIAALSWNAPTTRIDGNPVSPGEISGYRIYYGTDANNLQLLVDIGDATTTGYEVSGLPPATYYFAVTAYDIYGTESAYSNIESKTLL